MKILALDIGSSSVKAAILQRGEVISRIARVGFDTRFDGPRVEVEARDVLKAVARAIATLGRAAVRQVELIAPANMAPSWVAMDRRGKAITPIVTHQDRRSLAVAMEIEKTVGKARHLKLAGNRPVPGGISSTTWAWYAQNERGLMRRADLCGHVQTLLLRQLTGARVVDPSNASFMGLYSTMKLDGWCDELIAAAGATEHQLPQILGADEVAGMVTRSAGAAFGLTHGTPVLTGCVDGSAAMLLAGARPGQMVNVCGSTDVLALCTDGPRPHDNLITRALGVDRLWLSVSTVGSSGSSITWAKQALFADLSMPEFFKRVARLAEERLQKNRPTARVSFEPYLAGDRTSLEQRWAAFSGLSLSTTRDEMLAAILESLAVASAARLPLLATYGGVKPRRTVMVTGGVQEAGLDRILLRDWPGKWTFQTQDEATLCGLGKLQLAKD